MGPTFVTTRRPPTSKVTTQAEPTFAPTAGARSGDHTHPFSTRGRATPSLPVTCPRRRSRAARWSRCPCNSNRYCSRASTCRRASSSPCPAPIASGPSNQATTDSRYSRAGSAHRSPASPPEDCPACLGQTQHPQVDEDDIRAPGHDRMASQPADLPGARPHPGANAPITPKPDTPTAAHRQPRSPRHHDAVTPGEPHCAARRPVISPVQPGGTRREVPGSDALPRSERFRGTIAWQESNGRVQAYETRRCGTRVIWLKLDCLNLNLQEAQLLRPPERRLKPVPRPALTWCGGWCNLRDAERCPVRVFKEMNEEPKSR